MSLLERFFFLLIFSVLLPRQGLAEGDSASPPSTPTAPESQPTSWVAHIMQPKKDGAITGLTIPQMELPVVTIKSEQRFRPMVEVPLHYERPGWKLLIQGKIPVSPGTEEGTYKVFAYMNSRISELLLVAQGPDGAKEVERIYIYAPEAMEFNVVTPWDAVKLSLGSTYLAYQQTGYNNFYLWSGIVTAQIHSPENGGHLGYLADASITALRLASNQNNYGPQVAQILLDGIYFLPWKENSRWRFQAMAGGSYTTFLSNGSPFGFNNLMTPELGLRARYLINTKSDYAFEFRYMPMSTSGFTTERGIEFAAAKSWILPNLHRAEVGIRYEDLQYHPESFESVHLNTFSFLLSYSL